MKSRSIILTLFASLAVFASCEKPENFGEADISLSTKELTFDESASQQSISLNATRTWKVDGQLPDWITVNPMRGEACKNAQEITVAVTANEKGNRTADIRFTIGLFDTQLKVSQQGPAGDKVETTAIADFIKAADTQNAKILKGKITTLTKGDRYWGFDMNDGTGTVSAAFPANWDEWKDKLAEGGTVTVQGVYEKYVNKKGEAIDQVKKAMIIAFEAGEAVTPVEAEKIAIADFIKNADVAKPYKLEGTITKLTKGDRFWGFDMNDGTGTVTAAFPANWDAWKDKLAEGGIVTVQGTYEKYVNKKGEASDQVKKATILDFKNDGAAPQPEVPGDIKAVSIKEFLAAPVNDQQKFQLTGTIAYIDDLNYANINIKDESGMVLVYGMKESAEAQANLNMATMGIKLGDQITLVGTRGKNPYSDDAQVLNAYYVSHAAGQTPGFISWIGKSKAYTQSANVAGKEEVALKMGTSKAGGEVEFSLPSGTKELSFYAYAWKGKKCKLTFSTGDVFDLAAADACTGNPPYNFATLPASAYKVTVDAATALTVTADSRCVMFGFQLN